MSNDMPEEIWIAENEMYKCGGLPKYIATEIPIFPQIETKYIRADLVPQWQPIETLPQKDFMFTGYSKAYGAIPIRLTAAVDSDGNDLGLKFFCGITWGDAICVSDITHWMPIPQPPTQGE